MRPLIFLDKQLISRICCYKSSCSILRSTSAIPIIHRYLSSSNTFSRKQDSKNLKSSIDLISNWIPIYRFPFIIHARVFQRAKLYMTIIMAGIMPVGYLIEAESYRLSEMIWFAGAGGFSLALLYGFGNLFRRLIGSIYVSEDEKLVRISHLTFFGNRNEKIVPRDDILLLSDVNHNLNDYFLRVKTIDESPKDSLWICLKYGGIMNQKKFGNVFGID